ncbi:hypothetical protein ACE15N_12155 [Xanthomonas campestris pv. passiflorae]|uniref:hypothetical protein n=1 Tax=Xanthomonas campestris TaxID=339 RepID=UPI002425C5D7|nr:hypothetical protein [Xanthomonas campestris]MBV6815207.1 hypothetical protein [Xanthomonas campestris pv. passiflorae]
MDIDPTTKVGGEKEGGNTPYYPANGGQPDAPPAISAPRTASPGDPRFGQIPDAPIHALAPCVRP